MAKREAYDHYEPPVDTDLVITSIETQRKNELRRSIFINDEFAFGVCEEIYAKYALFKGRELTREFIAEILLADESYRCRQAALRLNAVRMRSRTEMARKLAERNFSEEAIADALSFLEEYGLLDDRAFARALIDQELLRRPIGRRRLEDDLRRRGVAADEIADAIGAAITDETELANALAAAMKKAPTIRTDDPRKWERSMANFLASRGFQWEVIGRVIARLKAESGVRNAE